MMMFLRELAGLFVDDGRLALMIGAVVVFAGIVTLFFPDIPLVAGAILLFGSLATLIVSVARSDGR